MRLIRFHSTGEGQPDIYVKIYWRKILGVLKLLTSDNFAHFKDWL